MNLTHIDILRYFKTLKTFNKRLETFDARPIKKFAANQLAAAPPTPTRLTGAAFWKTF